MAHVETVWWAVTIDCIDPARVAAFWAHLFGVPVDEVGPDRPGWRRIEPLGARGPFLNFQPVDEPKVGKARIHVDVGVTDLDQAAARVVELGGTDTGSREVLPRGSIAVVCDPEGNELCLLAPPSA